MNNEQARRLPYSQEAEQSVLGAILIKPESMDRIIGILTANDFYYSQHQKIFQTMQGMYLKSRSIDVVTLLDELVKDGVYDEAGGKEYIGLIADIVPTAANVLDYAKIVRDKAILRALINACETTAEEAYAGEEDARRLLEVAEKRIYSISDGNDDREMMHVRDAFMLTFNRLKELQTNRAEAMGMPTGFSGIDRLLLGMGKGDLIIVGARPGMGKSSFAMNVVVNAALRSKKSVCVFSLEMSCEQLATRLLSSEALVDSAKLRSAEFGDEEYVKLCHAASRLSGCNIYINDKPAMTVSGIMSHLRRVKDLGLVVIDYLGLMESEVRTDNKANEIGSITKSLKRMAMEFGVPVIVCAQLNRESEKSQDKNGVTVGKKPTLASLRDSGAIEQDADVVMFIYRPGEYDKNDPEKQTQAEVIIAKNRHGSQGFVKMNWLGRFTKFITLEEDEGLEER